MTAVGAGLIGMGKVYNAVKSMRNAGFTNKEAVAIMGKEWDY
jgi:hypothetical protein